MTLPIEPPTQPAETTSFTIGVYRPIYLWAGPGTIRMNRLKFMGQPVDEDAHREAHSPQGAQRVVEDIYSNWVHLTYNWGFPPEVEAEDWADFASAAQVYHAAGAKVFAYIQTSNCVFSGSNREKDWYARDPRGNKIFYYSGRYMTCLANPQWVAHLKETICGALERGADGIFLDNLWHGAMPDLLFSTWLGAAGCHCDRCRAAYHSAMGTEIPREIRPGDPNARRYLRWRADQVTGLVREMWEEFQLLRPGTPLSANDYDLFSRDTYLVFGQDLESLARVQDVVMIENHALPQLDLSHPKQPRLVNNALVLRNARRLVDQNAHLSVLSYDQGIGFEGLYPSRRYRLAMAEAAACGASMTIKGTEYFQDGRHTLITPQQFASLQAVIGGFQRWLAENAGLFHAGENCAAVGLLYPGEDLWLDWQRLTPLYQGAGQVLTWEGIPWRVVKAEDLSAGTAESLTVLLTFGVTPPAAVPPGVTVVHVPALAGWAAPAESAVSRSPLLRAVVSGGVHFLLNAYFSSRIARKVLDGMGMSALVLRSAVFDLPETARRAALLAALSPGLTPRVPGEDPGGFGANPDSDSSKIRPGFTRQSSGFVSCQTDFPLLVETWKRDGQLQVHLVNYSDQPQVATLSFAAPVHARAISPDRPEVIVRSGQVFDLPVDVYTILLVDGEDA